MNHTKLCLAALFEEWLPIPDEVRLFADTGFEGFFTHWEPGTDLALYRKAADEAGMLFQSVHAPVPGTDTMWRGGEAGYAAAEILVNCVRACADAAVPIMVCHNYTGFHNEVPVTEAGYACYDRFISEAKRLGVTVAIENSQAPRYLAALMERYRGERYVGFCWDSGHEMCYTPGMDHLALYGDRLVGTHLNDNLGVLAPDGEITSRDDIHLLPWDGIADWAEIGRRLARTGYEGPLTFELKRRNKPGRHTHDKYLRISLEEYVAEIFARARRFEAMLNREKENVI